MASNQQLMGDQDDSQNYNSWARPSLLNVFDLPNMSRASSEEFITGYNQMGRASVASSYMDDDDADSDTTSCNDEPISYDDYINSRRSSEYTNGTLMSQKSRQSVDFVDQGMYNSLARKYDSMDPRRKKQKWATGANGEDSGNGTDWKSDSNSISGAKIIGNPIDNEDDDDMELTRGTWDIFQTIPRERQSKSEFSLKFLKAIKVIMYGFLFCMVLITAVISKFSFINLASNAGINRISIDYKKMVYLYSHDPDEITDEQADKLAKDYEQFHGEIRNTAVTLLLLALIVPEALLFCSHLFKSIFGSQPWPTMRIILMSLIVSGLETFGHCLLVFKVLPSIDIVRGILLLSCIGFLPGIVRLIFGKESRHSNYAITKKIILVVAVIIQLTGPVAVLLFGYGWHELSLPTNTDNLRFAKLSNSHYFRDPAKWTMESLNQLALNYEVIVAILLVNLSWCENFLERNRTVFGKNLNVCKLKSILHTVRQKTYVFLPLWKGLLIICFVYALVPNYRMQVERMDFKNRTDPDIYARKIFAEETQTIAEKLIEKIGKSVIKDQNSIGGNGHKNMSEALEAAMSKVYVSKNAPGADKHPKGYLETVTEPENNIKLSLTLMYENLIESGDEYKDYALDTLDALVNEIEYFSKDTRDLFRDYRHFIMNTDKPGHLIFEYLKQALEEYWTIVFLFIASMMCSYFAKLSCKLCMQFAGFSVPLLLAGPVTVIILFLECQFGFLPGYTHWICMEEDRKSDIFYYTCALGFLWWISQHIIVSHIWNPCKERLARTDKLFVVPGWSMTLIEQSLLYNRRRNDSEVVVTGVDNHIDYIGPGSSMMGSSASLSSKRNEESRQNDYVVPKIHAVATMWHETRNEMTQLLKSIFRMDCDQSARRNAQKYFGIRDPDYYEFEAHILFDDSMEFNDDEERIPNSFVVTLCEVIDAAASSVHETQVTNPPPTRIPTPYGGQLKWTLPGGTILTAHLKDKDKIRHKKRWSQVMYMYYLLGYKLICEDDDYMMRTMRSGPGKHISWAKSATKSQKRRKTTHYTKSDIFDVMGEDFHVKSENTFLLTLDGDVDFKPDAVRLLMDRMKKNKKVGAACGRIHPIGTGPMIWFQEFEYACGHWLQKAAEHVFGCVLCAPGCFSLFRGSALMDDNVMNTYTTRASKAAEFVQFDQGEDRWLCTLILQQGYRVEYCAASDALTYAPEQFNEFYNQRRRWGPSTMANIIDLLSDSSNTVMVNDNISKLYLIYQFLVFASSILGPATVMLMTAGAYHTVFRVDIYWSYGLALIPPGIFIAVCILMSSNHQLIIAAILSAFYAVIMMVVLVGTAINFLFEGWTSPNVIFVMLLICVFVIAAILHPQELLCMMYGPLYFLCIPSGYLLLTIYFLCNLNIISWGTREIQTKKTKAQMIQEEKERIEAEKKKKENRFLNRIGLSKMVEDLKELFSTMTGFRQGVAKSDPQTDLLKKMCETLEALPDRISGKSPTPKDKETKSIEVQCGTETEAMIPDDTIPEVIEHNDEPEKPKRPPRDDLRNPAWLEDERLGDGPIMYINRKEAVFWKQLISRYLYPLVMDKDEKKRLADELIALRNNVVFAFFMLNFLWIVVVFQFHLLQSSLNQDLFNKNGGSQLRNCTRMSENGLFIPIPRTDGTCVGIEPLSFIFLTLFTVILLTQFVGMFVHRWGTFLHLIAITQIKWPWNKKMGDLTQDTMAAIELVQQLQKVRDLDPLERFNGDTDGSSIYSLSTIDQSHTGTTTEADSEIVKPRTRRPKRNGHLSLDRVFRKRFHRLKKELEVDIATDAESSNEGAGDEDVPHVGNKVYRTVRQRMTARRTASFHIGQRHRERRSSVEEVRQPRFHDI